MKNICFVAAAGAGKTTQIISMLSTRLNSLTFKKIAIVTYTINNQNSLRKKLIDKFGKVPDNIIILGWYTFLLDYWIKPYKCDVIEELYNVHLGFLYVEGKSGVSSITHKCIYNKHEPMKKYISVNHKIYSDKTSEFANECYNKNKRNLLNRLSLIFDSIFFDESQDFVGYDFDIIKYLVKSKLLSCVIVGDPRQHTYATHYSNKNQKYLGRIDSFLSNKVNTTKHEYIKIDKNSLSNSHRCINEICDFASLITPDYSNTKQCTCQSCNDIREKYKGLKGCFLVREEEVDLFLKEIKPVVLVDSMGTKISDCVEEMQLQKKNMGESKGLEFDSVLIYATKPITKWIQNHQTPLAPGSRAKFYVAVTRARYAVAIVVPNKFLNQNLDIPFWKEKHIVEPDLFEGV